MTARGRRGTIAAVISALAVLGILGGLVGFLESIPRAEPLAGERPPATPDADFRVGFQPLLADAASEARKLVAIAERRERNLLTIRAGQQAMEEALGAADAWLATHPPAEADAPGVAAYRAGAASIRSAMTEAQAGFLRFDFDRVARATAQLSEGEAALELAISLLR